MFMYVCMYICRPANSHGFTVSLTVSLPCSRAADRISRFLRKVETLSQHNLPVFFTTHCNTTIKVQKFKIFLLSRLAGLYMYLCMYVCMLVSQGSTENQCFSLSGIV